MDPKIAVQRVSTFKIFISNLPNNLKNEDVGKLFEPYGRVVESEVFKGNYAFVHMEDGESGRKAIEQLNGKEMDGSIISIVKSKNTLGPKIPTMKLSVKNLPATGVSPMELRNLFTKYGYVLEAEVWGSQGHVLLEATGDIRSAINGVNGREIQGQALKVEAVTNFSANSSTSFTTTKILGKRKVPLRPPGPYDRKVPPPTFMPPSNYGHFPPPGGRRPGMPPHMGRPGRGRGTRPFFRPPPPVYGQGYDYSYDEVHPGGYHGPEQDFPGHPYSEPYQTGRPPAFMHHDNDYNDSYEPLYQRSPYYSGRPFNHPKAIPRNRLDSSKQLFKHQKAFFQQNEHLSSCFNEYYEDNEVPPRTSPAGSRGPPPLMGENQGKHPGAPGFQTQLSRTAKVTKFGKVVVNGSETKASQYKNAGGNRGGAQLKSKKTKHGQLPSLMDGISQTGTPEPSGTPDGFASTSLPIRNTGPHINSSRSTRLIMQHQQPRPSTFRVPNGPPVRALMRPPAVNQSTNSLLALYHESKRSQPLSIMGPPKQDIDFTADIDIV